MLSRSKVLHNPAGYRLFFHASFEITVLPGKYIHCTVRLQKACALFRLSSRSPLHNQGRHLVPGEILGNCAAAQKCSPVFYIIYLSIYNGT